MDLNASRDGTASSHLLVIKDGDRKIILSGSLNHTFGGRAPRSDRGECTRSCEVVGEGSREEVRWIVPARRFTTFVLTRKKQNLPRKQHWL